MCRAGRRAFVTSLRTFFRWLLLGGLMLAVFRFFAVRSALGRPSCLWFGRSWSTLPVPFVSGSLGAVPVGLS